MRTQAHEGWWWAVTLDRIAAYEQRRAAHHRDPLATAAANKLAREAAQRALLVNRHPYARALAARAVNQLTPTEGASREYTAVTTRLEGANNER